MLNGLLKFIDNIKNFSAEEVVTEELTLDKNEIVIMVRLQLESGIDGNDDKVYLYRRGARRYNYARYTIQQKDIFGSGIGAITDHITNYMTGNFYNSIYVEVYSDASFQVKSTDWIYEIIKERSGADIIRLSPESEAYLFKHTIGPDIQKQINKLYFG
jgi:hypothetical protein